MKTTKQHAWAVVSLGLTRGNNGRVMSARRQAELTVAVVDELVKTGLIELIPEQREPVGVRGVDS